MRSFFFGAGAGTLSTTGDRAAAAKRQHHE
jgi:hypothetical protein